MSRVFSLWWLGLTASLGFIVTASLSASIVDLRITKSFYDLDAIREAVNIFARRNHRFPTDAEGLAVLAPTILKRVSRDPWGNDYVYRVSGAMYYVYSVGIDERDDRGAGDDVTNREKKYECDKYGVDCPPDAFQIASFAAVGLALLSVVVGLARGVRWLGRRIEAMIHRRSR